MEKTSYLIAEEKLTSDLKSLINKGFGDHAQSVMGCDEKMVEVTLTAREGETLLGAVHAKTFWGGLHIKKLYVSEEARGKGIGSRLMRDTMERGRQLGCRFAYVETLSFQAVDFYKKMGFQEEFVREGYAKGVSFHYLRRDL